MQSMFPDLASLLTTGQCIHASMLPKWKATAFR